MSRILGMGKAEEAYLSVKGTGALRVYGTLWPRPLRAGLNFQERAAETAALSRLLYPLDFETRTEETRPLAPTVMSKTVVPW